MSRFPCINENHLENIARILGDEITGSKLTDIFKRLSIIDNSGESTKWRRVYYSLLNRQRQDRCGNNIADFIKTILAPAMYLGNEERFEEIRGQVNKLLSFDGLTLNNKGEFELVTKAKTISDAEKRTRTLSSKLQGRNIHPEVLKFCKLELLQDNYFHAVFEATKSLAQKVRKLTELQLDGAELVDTAFSLKSPLLAFNTLQTESEKSEHKGFALLLKGCFSAIRNPRAHEPKILWTNDEHEVADYLTLISLLYRKLDNAVLIPQASQKGSVILNKH
jgi:uncharacterized protein (TIGR02391 family)